MSTVDWYLSLKLVHVLSAIVAVGTNVTYFVWLVAMRGRSQAEQGFALQTIKALDSRLANPVRDPPADRGDHDPRLGRRRVHDVLDHRRHRPVRPGGVIAGVFFAPSLRRQTELVATDGPATGAYEAAARRTRTTGHITMLPVAGILYLMVLTPAP
jgi:hypothetical protein